MAVWDPAWFPLPVFLVRPIRFESNHAPAMDPCLPVSDLFLANPNVVAFSWPFRAYDALEPGRSNIPAWAGQYSFPGLGPMLVACLIEEESAWPSCPLALRAQGTELAPVFGKRLLADLAARRLRRPTRPNYPDWTHKPEPHGEISPLFPAAAERQPAGVVVQQATQFARSRQQPPSDRSAQEP